MPPTRGVFKGDGGSELSVAVAVTPAEAPIHARVLAPSVSWIAPEQADDQPQKPTYQQQQQQQQ